MKYTRRFLSLAAGFAAFTLTAAPVVPGEYTDPSCVKRVLDVEEPFETPVEFRHPYISTYYVEPTITVNDKAEIGYFITDFDHSLVRLRDDSFRFDVHLTLVGPDGRKYTDVKKNIKSGDGRFVLPRLAKGEYRVGVWGVDLKKNLESHRVWHRFRVLEPADLVIPADKIYNVTDADLKKYGICNKGDLGRMVLVEVPEVPNKVPFLERFKIIKKDVEKYAAANPSKPAGARPGYTIYAPARDGKIIVNSWRSVLVVNDPGYDTNKVEQASIRTAEGLQKLLDDKAAAGFRKVVLKPGTYRVSSHRKILVPSNMTFDLNGATLKANAFTGSSGVIVAIEHAYDAHLVNGTLEGDYFEHDYAGSPNNSEWPLGFSLHGESLYSSVENVYVKNITGYGGSNHQSKKNGVFQRFWRVLGKFVRGALDPATGEVVDKGPNFATSDFTPLKPETSPFVQVSKYLGYQGVLTRQWTMTGCWYDKDKKFLSSETLFQYRAVPVPRNAAFLRVTVFVDSIEYFKKYSLNVLDFFVPQNCTIKNCTFDRARCVGYAASAMKNFLFKDNLFTRSGESAAKCAFDAEDGWDQMHDVLFRGNKCRDNPVNNSLLTCAGHNFMFEKNDCDIHFWPRTYSPCVRDNDFGKASFMCDGRVRTGYGRFSGNRYAKSLTVLKSTRPDRAGWDFAFHDFDLKGDGTNQTFTISFSDSARTVNSKFEDRKVSIAKAVGCLFKNCNVSGLGDGIWVGNVVEGGNISNFKSTNEFTKCEFKNVHFRNFMGGCQTFRGCTFTDCQFVLASGGDLRFENCTLKGSYYWNGYWVKAGDVSFRNCRIDVNGKHFCRLGAYGVGRTLFESCRITSSGKPGAIFCDIDDWRASKQGDSVRGSIEIRDCTFSEGFKHAIGTGSGAGLAKIDKFVPTKTIDCLIEKTVMAPGVDAIGPLPRKGRREVK